MNWTGLWRIGKLQGNWRYGLIVRTRIFCRALKLCMGHSKYYNNTICESDNGNIMVIGIQDNNRAYYR